MGLNRVASVPVAGKSTRLPCFFPSISSVKTNLRPSDYLEFLTAAGQPLFLISAYDIARAEADERSLMVSLLSKASASGTVILMDSGQYEAFWMSDTTWEVRAFHEVAKSTPHHFCFCHDNQSPPASAEAIADDIIASVLRDEAAAGGTIIPIAHAPTAILPGVARRVAMQLYPPMVAVPERELGDGILARAGTVRAIRDALDDTGIAVPLHLLGTGNPISLLIYALAGADSFDGLEWCQTVVDHKTGRLHHFQHWDFFADQTNSQRDGRLPYIQSVLLHNLMFFGRFLPELAQALADGDGEALARKWLSAEEWDRVRPVLAGGRK